MHFQTDRFEKHHFAFANVQVKLNKITFEAISRDCCSRCSRIGSFLDVLLKFVIHNFCASLRVYSAGEPNMEDGAAMCVGPQDGHTTARR